MFMSSYKTTLDYSLLHKVLTEIKGTDYKEINSYVVVAATDFEIDNGLVIRKKLDTMM